LRKQGQTTFFLLCLLCATPTWAAKQGGKPSFAPAPPSSGAGSSAGRAGGHGARTDPRRAPPMDRSRKVNAQDCTKPVDPSAGNLKCK
jgi:hypothetical protein